MMGVLSELMVRIYYESQSRRPYKVRNAYIGGREEIEHHYPKHPSADAAA
jgi:hypothetical protein